MHNIKGLKKLKIYVLLNSKVLAFVFCILCLAGCKKETTRLINRPCYLPVTDFADDGGVTERYLGEGAGTYPGYYFGPALAGHTNKIVIDQSNKTIYLLETPGNIKGTLMDMGDRDCSFINELDWNIHPSEQTVTYNNGHCYFGLLPDGDTVRLYTEVIEKDVSVLLYVLYDTVRVPYHRADSLFVGRYYNQNKISDGVVAYILQPGDLGYNPMVTHGLIAAERDLPTIHQWGLTSQVGNTSALIGTGKANTDSIISKFGDFDYAAHECRNYNNQPDSGWYLPSIDELNAIFANKDLISGPNYPFNYSYWTSTEVDATTALIGSPDFVWVSSFDNKIEFTSVRPVRSF